MGYSTSFDGEFTITPALDMKTYSKLKKLADYNYAISAPQAGRPSSYCQWVPTDEGDSIHWDGEEKFYLYEEWLQYIIDEILKPAGFKLSGQVTWQGEETGDVGVLSIADDKVIATKFDVDKNGVLARARQRLKKAKGYRTVLEHLLTASDNDSGDINFMGVPNRRINETVLAMLDIADILEESDDED